MKSLVDFLKCGRYVSAQLSFNRGDFIVSNLPDIVEKLIPFFKEYRIMGTKYLDFEDFCEIATMMVTKGHTTIEGLEKIKKNKRRYEHT